jgi:AraC-like DNA-binding protein
MSDRAPARSNAVLPDVRKVITSEGSSFLYKVRDEPTFAFSWHCHPEYQLTLICSSAGRRFVGDSIEDYASGDLVLLGPNLPHTWHSEAKRHPTRRHKAIVVQFAESFLGPGFFDRPEFKATAALLQASARGLQFQDPVRQRVSRRLVALGDCRPLDRLLGLLAVLDELARSRSFRPLASPGFAPMLNEATRRRIDRVCAYINAHYTGGVTELEASRIAHMSPSAFSRFFHQATGKTFTRYVNELRVGLACRLLIESDRPVTSICFEAGFANVSNFNRRFLELKRLSPSAYRRAFVAADEPTGTD